MLFVIYVLVLFFVPAFAPPPPVTPNAPSNRIWMQGWSTLPPGSSRPPSPQPEVNPSDETQHIPSPVDHLPPASANKLPEVNPSQHKPSGSDETQHIPPHPVDHLPPASANKLPEVNPSQHKLSDETQHILPHPVDHLPPASANKLPEVNPSQHKPSDETQHIPPHPVDHLPPASANKLPEVNPSQAKPADPPPSSASGGGSKGNAQSGQVNSSQHKPADHPASAPDDTHQKVNSSRKRYLWEEGWTKLPSEVGPSGLQVQSQTADQVHLPASQRNIAGGGHEGIAKPVNPSLPKPADHPARANMVDAPADAHPSHDASHPIHSPTSGLQVQSQTAHHAGVAPSPQVHLPVRQDNSVSGAPKYDTPIQPVPVMPNIDLNTGMPVPVEPPKPPKPPRQMNTKKAQRSANRLSTYRASNWNRYRVRLPVSQHKPAADHASSGPQTNAPGHQAHPTQHQTGKK